ncbi:FecR family protein [Arachidicoccus terrestris]|uniref:FecR family protein n=1 Tax=Arachidicoccus terrestris TaxID=2875539 RepID=UPI001CC430A4|nr:FecR family protein [Arachidicoccus terrestris]UAY57105.1 DUF4974 domain-containing protein [Arachidicoccus terrestris]
MDPNTEDLLNKWLDGSLTRPEADTLLQACKDPELQSTLDNWLFNQYDHPADKAVYFSREQKRVIYNKAIRPDTGSASAVPAIAESLMQFRRPADAPGTAFSSRRKSRRRRMLKAAASICIIGCLVFLFFKLNHPPAPVKSLTQATVSDIAAPLLATPTISWGQSHQAIAIDQALKDRAARISQDKNGCLVFNPVSPTAPSGTVSVPRGSRPVHIQLPDGSQVWINTGSSLRFPGMFDGSKRTVYLTGEAYFEVVHNKKQIFEVRQGDNTVSVLGTHFNINGYADNPATKVTLLTGLVQVNHASYLHPAEQAVVKEGSIQIHKDIDLQQVMAWKNNQFYFNGTTAQDILRQLARWYNIEIVYKGQVPQGHYSGIISKDNSLSQVLTILETGGIKFKLHQQSLWIY